MRGASSWQGRRCFKCTPISLGKPSRSARVYLLALAFSFEASPQFQHLRAQPLTSAFPVAQTEDLSTADLLLSNGDFDKALPILQRLASEGDAIAKYKLAEMYYRGAGVAPDHVKAAGLYEAAAKDNIVRAGPGNLHRAISGVSA
jgi:TPR repeat protein